MSIRPSGEFLDQGFQKINDVANKTSQVVMKHVNAIGNSEIGQGLCAMMVALGGLLLALGISHHSIGVALIGDSTLASGASILVFKAYKSFKEKNEEEIVIGQDVASPLLQPQEEV